MVLQTGMEFTHEVRNELMERGYTHILHTPPKTLHGDENYVHFIEPVKFEDPRHDYEEAELFIQDIADFEVSDMASGIIGVIFRIKMPQY